MNSSARVALVVAALASTAASLRAQEAGSVPVTIDDQGVMRWSADGREVSLFGVNYTAPFAYSYRAHGYVGADRKASIDADVNHLARLGLDAYRVHVWDREISDRAGNLVENDHLDLFDYLIARLEERDIKILLTPIAWNGNGYPERDQPTEGFSNDYSKGELTVDPAARVIEEHYLQQFIGHVNPYTGLSYRDDPSIIGIELLNEPSHPGTPEQVTEFIDDLTEALREAGYRKPVFYNISQGWSAAHAVAVCSANIQGVTFQWYPTGLVRGGTIRTNMLPNVDSYPIPFGETPECADKARAVYEFASADVMGSYMYPAMARSFRRAGMQWATQFAYDPLAIAPFNTEYQTHYVNLVYTPRKALSLMIAGEAFRRTPRHATYDAYPADTLFGPFRVSYAENLSEMNTPEAFYYSGDTRTPPADSRVLRHVAGYGSSGVVHYEGRGAYFLDRLADGVWRLEIYPDVVEVADPFARPSLDREVMRLLWREWPMTISLPDLGTAFTVTAVNQGNSRSATAAGGEFLAWPGVYVLRREGVSGDAWTDPTVRAGRVELGEFHVPVREDAASQVVHRPALDVTAGEAMTIRAQVVSPVAPEQVELAVRGGADGPFVRTTMRRVSGIDYEASVPPELVKPGVVEYSIVVHLGGQTLSFPGANPRNESGDSVWRVHVADPGDLIVLFDVARDAGRVLAPHPFRYVRFRADTVAGSSAGSRALRVEVESFRPEPHNFAIRSFLGDENSARLANAGDFNFLRVRARSSTTSTEKLEIALVDENGAAWGAVASLTPQWRDVRIPLASLHPVALALLPRPYPEFLPNSLAPFEGQAALPVVRELAGVQIRMSGALFDPESRDAPHGFEIESITLERDGTRQRP